MLHVYKTSCFLSQACSQQESAFLQDPRRPQVVVTVAEDTGDQSGSETEGDALEAHTERQW